MTIMHKESNFYEELEIYYLKILHAQNDNIAKKKCFLLSTIKVKIIERSTLEGKSLYERRVDHIFIILNREK